MKLILCAAIFIIAADMNIRAQYDDTGKRGLYFSKKEYSGGELPVFNESKDKLPIPVLSDDKEWEELYWKSWELAFRHYKKPPAGSPFVSNYIDEAFSPSIFQWDTFFMIMFARYADHIFPAIQSLDNFYCRQYENGYIDREIVEADGSDYLFIGREHTINPPLFSWAEVENYKITGDKSRFRAILPALEKYAEWLEKYRKNPAVAHGLYWQTGLGSGMDNTPREGSGWIDMSAQMAMYYKDMALICRELKLKDKEELYKKKSEDIAERINKFMWNEEDGFYYDVDDKGAQIKHKTIASFWPMLAGICSKEQAEKLVFHLKDPKSFWRPIPFPTLAADQPEYHADGHYWLGGVWAPTNVAAIKGSEHYGYYDFAYLATETYLDGMYNVYKKTGTIWENYSPESYSPGNPAKPDFVGWSGCGPIQLLIENILGFAPNGAGNKLVWNISRIDEHGIKNLRFGSATVSVIAKKRESVTSPVEIEAVCDKSFELTVRYLGSLKTFMLGEGKHNLTIK